MKKLFLSVALVFSLSFALPQTISAATTSGGKLSVEVVYLRHTGLTLTRTYVDGVCIGWSLKDQNGNTISSGSGKDSWQ